MAKNKKEELSYFLDHPQIKRHKSPGNGNKPGSLAESINWGGKNTESQNAKVKSSQTSSSKPQTKSGSESKSSGWASSIKKAFGGK